MVSFKKIPAKAVAARFDGYAKKYIEPYFKQLKLSSVAARKLSQEQIFVMIEELMAAENENMMIRTKPNATKTFKVQALSVAELKEKIYHCKLDLQVLPVTNWGSFQPLLSTPSHTGSRVFLAKKHDFSVIFRGSKKCPKWSKMGNIHPLRCV